jgi:hypothetical protein
LFMLFVANKSLGQVSIEYLNIVTSSANYTYVGVNYQPDYNWMPNSGWGAVQDLLSARTSLYEKGFGIVDNEYTKLINLNLINQQNRLKLVAHQNEIKSWAKLNISKYDFSIQSNVTSVVNYITSIYKLSPIRDEIRLLNDINLWSKYFSKENQIGKEEYFKDVNTILDELKFWDESKLSRNTDQIFEETRKNNYNKFKNDINTRLLSAGKSNVPDGWHRIYFANKSTLDFGRIDAHVLNGRVTIIKSKGKEYKVVSGGDIYEKYCKSVEINSMDVTGSYGYFFIELFFLD